MTYRCQHCGKDLFGTEQYVEVCQCPASIQSDQAGREQAKQIARQNQMTFEEARKKNKRPIRERKQQENK